MSGSTDWYYQREGAQKAAGRVHGVVHAAGSRITQPYVSNLDLDEWKRVLDADVNGFLHVAKAAIPHFRAKGGGAFTFVSTAGLARFSPGDILSIGPKGAIEALLFLMPLVGIGLLRYVRHGVTRRDR